MCTYNVPYKTSKLHKGVNTLWKGFYSDCITHHWLNMKPNSEEGCHKTQNGKWSQDPPMLVTAIDSLHWHHISHQILARPFHNDVCKLDGILVHSYYGVWADLGPVMDVVVDLLIWSPWDTVTCHLGEVIADTETWYCGYQYHSVPHTVAMKCAN